MSRCLYPLSIQKVGLLPCRTSLRADVRRPGQFANTFRPARQGVFRVSVPVPESGDVLQASIEVVVPNLESEDPSQDVRLLKGLTENTGGTYLSAAGAGASACRGSFPIAANRSWWMNS